MAIPTQTTGLATQTPWLEGVTARIVTRMGLRLNNPNATVDITEHPRPGLATTHKAHCQPCGWQDDAYADRNKVLDKAQYHADLCSALPKPTTA